MEKKLFEKDLEKIEVPTEEIANAIHKGVSRARIINIHRPKWKRARTASISLAAAAAMFFSLGFFNPSVAKVLADIPVFDKLYGTDTIGSHLGSEQLVTRLNQNAVNHGIKVSITSAYYDGAVIGITFNVKGNVHTAHKNHLIAFYEVFGGDPNIDDSKELATTSLSDNGYIGHIQLNYQKETLPKHTVVPLTFKQIGDQKGTWKFKVPVRQLPFEKMKIDKTSSSSDGSLKVHFDSMIFGKSSTTINYTAFFPSSEKNDSVGVEFSDGKGHSVHWLSNGSISAKIINGQKIVKGRAIIPENLDGKLKELKIQPLFFIYEKNRFVALDEQLPAVLKASRQNFYVKVDQIQVHGNKATVDFQVNGGDRHGRYLVFYKDFAKNAVDLVKKAEKDINQMPMRHSVQVLNKKELKFRSTFDIGSINHFKAADYLLRVQLGYMTTNMQLKLKPVSISLDQ